MPTVFIPPQMREVTGGADRVVVDGRSLRQVIVALDERHPGLASRLLEGDKLARGLAVSIDGVVSSRGLLTQVQPESEVHFLPAIGGG